MQINHRSGRIEVIAQAILPEHAAVIRVIPQEGANAGASTMHDEGEQIARALLYSLTGPAITSMLAELLHEMVERCETVGRDDMARVYRNAMHLEKGHLDNGLADSRALEEYAQREADERNTHESEAARQPERRAWRIGRNPNPFAALLDAAWLALPYVETAEQDPAYKPGAVAKVSRQLRQSLELADAEEKASKARQDAAAVHQIEHDMAQRAAR